MSFLFDVRRELLRRTGEMDVRSANAKVTWKNGLLRAIAAAVEALHTRCCTTASSERCAG